MTDNRDLLFTDICARLKYNVKVRYKCFHVHSVQGLTSNGLIVLRDETDNPITTDIKNIQPYLFPLSSMTEEQRDFIHANPYGIYIQLFDNTLISASIEGFDWLNAHHFDYRGLIEKGLAIEINKSNNPYKK
jgi:hypothetical protein